MKRRLNLTIHPQIYSKAEALAKLLDYDGVNPLIEHLIRQEFESRHGQLRIPGEDQAKGNPAPPNHSKPARGKKKK